jgi:hypothetical protein
MKTEIIKMKKELQRNRDAYQKTEIEHSNTIVTLKQDCEQFKTQITDLTRAKEELRI